MDNVTASNLAGLEVVSPARTSRFVDRWYSDASGRYKVLQVQNLQVFAMCKPTGWSVPGEHPASSSLHTLSQTRPAC